MFKRKPWFGCFLLKSNEYDQEMPQLHSAAQPTALQGKDTEHSHKTSGRQLNLNAPIATKVVCFSRLLKYLRGLYGKQCGHRSDCSYRIGMFWVHTDCFYT